MCPGVLGYAEKVSWAPAFMSLLSELLRTVTGRHDRLALQTESQDKPLSPQVDLAKHPFTEVRSVTIPLGCGDLGETGNFIGHLPKSSNLGRRAATGVSRQMR